MQQSAVSSQQWEAVDGRAALRRRAARVYASARTPEQVQTAHRYLRLAARRLEPKAGPAQDGVYANLLAEGMKATLMVMAEEVWRAGLSLWAAQALQSADREAAATERRLH